jgi:hypothetical protein
MFKYPFHLISPSRPLSRASSFTQRKPYQSLVFASSLTAVILQLDLNRRSNTFAGKYALAAYLNLARRGLEMLWFWERVAGRSAGEGLFLGEVVWVGTDVVWAWQAWRMPRVEQVEE